jgi:hypothetical protein
MQAAAARPETRPPRWAGRAALVLGVALLHGLLLRPSAPPPAAAGAVAAPSAPVVWQLVAPTAPAADGSAAAAIAADTGAAGAGPADGPAAGTRVATIATTRVTPPATTTARPMARVEASTPRARPLPAAGAASPAAEPPAPEPAPADATAARRADPGPNAAEAARTAEPGPAPADGPTPPAAAPIPVYATQLPPPARLHYRLHRDGTAGEARLDWAPDGKQYRLRLQGEVDGRPLGGASSRGAIDADGLAPVRLADLKRGREVRAANFRRDERRITFSGPAVEHALLPGVQDRLSWMIQLPAVVQANPGLRHDGARVTLLVVGTRGEAEAWHFDAQGAEPLADLPGGPAAAALRFVREPVRPYDLRVEVWLDPARGHLPVRARLATRPETRTTEWRLAAIEAP